MAVSYRLKDGTLRDGIGSDQGQKQCVRWGLLDDPRSRTFLLTSRVLNQTTWSPGSAPALLGEAIVVLNDTVRKGALKKRSQIQLDPAAQRVELA
jgi:hypothetical protein